MISFLDKFLKMINFIECCLDFVTKFRNFKLTYWHMHKKLYMLIFKLYSASQPEPAFPSTIISIIYFIKLVPQYNIIK